MSKNAKGADNQQGSPLFGIAEHDPSETTRQIPHITKELACLLGLLFTDGCVSRKGKSSWRIYFSNKPQALVDLFQDCIQKIFNLEADRVRLGKTKDGLIRAIVDSKEIGDYLVSRFGTFRSLKYSDEELPDTRLPVLELKQSGCASEFLRSAFSCDGGVSLYPAYRAGKQGGTTWLIRSVYLACAHNKLRADYMELLEHLGIFAREVSKDGKIKIERKEDIVRFNKTIGFVERTQITHTSQYWGTCEKQYLLDLLIKSYGNPSSVYNLPQFTVR